MKQEIGIRELKNQASNNVRQVREESAEYIVTHGNEVVENLNPQVWRSSPIQIRAN